jgi:hypothetical protein
MNVLLYVGVFVLGIVFGIFIAVIVALMPDKDESGEG